jgi:hypothetical protein
MLLQGSLGLLMPDQYRDAGWITATWYGNDWVTVAIAVPLLSVGTHCARRGSVRGLLLVAGVAAYAVYNYAFYLFGAALNVFFVLYVLSFLVGVATLGLSMALLDADGIARSAYERAPVRLVGGYLVFVAAGLACVWLGMWGAYAFAGRPTPVEPEAFKVVAALDLTVLVPALGVGGVLLWRRRPWGYPVATVAAIQGAVYLLVLCVNASIAIRRGLATPPGELLLWTPLAAATAIAAALLLSSAPVGRRAVQPVKSERR